MELSAFFKSVIDQDRAPVVLCDLEHPIIYMNPAAIGRYAKLGGEKLIGQNLLTCHNLRSQEMIQKDGCLGFRETLNITLSMNFTMKKTTAIYTRLLCATRMVR